MEVTRDFARYAFTAGTPTQEPLTASEAKLHCRMNATSTSEDEFIRRAITAARLHAEKVDGRTYIATTHTLRLDEFPGGDGEIMLPRPPLRAVTLITYIDDTGATATLSATGYATDVYSTPGRVMPSYGNSWPSTRCEPNAVTITYSAGYGTSASDVPADRRNLMLYLIGDWYNNRESVAVGTVTHDIANTFNALLNADRGSYL